MKRGAVSERDVARWLKDMGYRGQGLKRESLQPLCRREMEEIWSALIGNTAPVGVVQEMKVSVEMKLQRRAAFETRQKIKQDSGERRQRALRVKQLRQTLSERKAELGSKMNRVECLKSHLARVESSHISRKASMGSDLERTLILRGYIAKTEQIAKSVESETKSLKDQISSMRVRSESQSQSDGGGDCLKLIKELHNLSVEHIRRALSDQEINSVSPQEIHPGMLRLFGDNDDPVLRRLRKSMAELYNRHGHRLAQVFLSDSEEEFRKVQLYEATYSVHTLDETLGLAPNKVIEEMQALHLRSFLRLQEAEDKCKEAFSSIKNSSEIQHFLYEMDKAGYSEILNYVIEGKCLEREIEVLSAEIEKLESQAANKTGIDFLKSEFRMLRRRMEQSRFTDSLIENFFQRNQNLKMEFDRTVKEIRDQVENQLLDMLQELCGSISGWRKSIREEISHFGSFDVSQITKQLASEPRPWWQPPLLQRMDLARTGAAVDYWTVSIRELWTQLKPELPSLSVGSPEEIFFQLSDALRSSLCNAGDFVDLRSYLKNFSVWQSLLESQSDSLLQKELGRRWEVDSAVDRIDQLLFEGRHSLQILQKDIPTAMEDLKELPAFKRPLKSGNHWA